MKIGIDCRLWNETGVGRYIRNLVLNLQKIDKKNKYVLFVLPKDHKEIKSQLSTFNSQLVVADIRWHTLKEQLKFPKILNKENLDLVHFPYHSVPIFYSKPFILTIHDLIPYNFPTGKASTLPFPLYYLKLLGYKFVISQAARRARKILAISNATKNEIIDHLKVDSSKIAVTYEGIDNKLINSQFSILNSQLKNFSKEKFFLYVGNAYPHKNLERLLETFSAICQNDISLILVGKEDYFYQRLKKKVKEMKLSDKVIFMHNVSDEELSNLYKNAIAFITPSLMEGFGLPALEAMANKCLVLASDIKVIREVCGDAAIYFNPLNVDDIKKTMGEVCFNNLPAIPTDSGRQVQAGLNHFSEKVEKGLARAKLFSWHKMAKKTLRVYKEAVFHP